MMDREHYLLRVRLRVLVDNARAKSLSEIAIPPELADTLLRYINELEERLDAVPDLRCAACKSED